MERGDNGKYICPHNPECECNIPECAKCGWNPTVAKRRLEKIREELGVTEKLYKVPFTGHCEVYAKSEEEAADKADQGDMFFVEYDFAEPICMTEEDEDELD